MPQTFPDGILVQDAAVITDTPGQEATIRLDGDNAEISLGHTTSGSRIRLKDLAGKDRVVLEGLADKGKVTVDGELWIGPMVPPTKTSFYFDTNTGEFLVRDENGRFTFRAEGKYANLIIGTRDAGGDLIIYNAQEKPAFSFHSDTALLRIGSHGKAGSMGIYNSSGQFSVILDGNKGDIILQNADCAEDFDVLDAATVEPGMVLVIADDGRLRACDTPYSKRVAGVVSGANGCNPAIILDRGTAQKEDRKPIALNGKVYCWVDADFGSIEVGDMLTTSATPGHAMKVDDPAQAFGAVLGKALAPQPHGRGLIPIIVALQ